MSEQTCILCVDDERNVLRALERIFLDDDYEIICAPSGEEGLALLEETPEVQVVISDYRMPGMNGVDFLKEVFARRPDTVRIVLSGYADTAAVVAAINEGKIYKFIPKPWNDDELRLTVAKALETQAIHRHNQQLTEELSQKNEELSRLNQALENLVEARTAELRLQNRALVQARNVLEQLPVAVLGLTPEGMVAQVNREAELMLGQERGELLGRQVKGLFREEIDGLVQEIAAHGCGVRTVDSGGSTVRIKGVAMNSEEGEQGIVLVLKGPHLPEGNQAA